ncbi:alpha/beta hydrolase [Streptomyces sp. NPDC050619]|uniref:alpha/beta fold hydrolase n=1 Tax=Streptomyces sp. NPDC050619 TaxID=3157214 RepID=UPI003436BCEF
MSGITVRYGYVDTPLGQLHYTEAGAGEPLILLHQTPRSLDEFTQVQPLLAAERRVIAMDMYGFGLSAKPPAPQTIEQYASGVLALADALGLTTFAVLGHHTGMFVASEVAAAAPGRVTAAILSAGAYADAHFREPAAGSDVDTAEKRDDGSHLTTLWAKRAPLYPAGRPDLLDRFIRDALAPGVDPREGHLACKRYVMEDRVGLVTAPVLLLAATADPVSYPHSEQLSKVYTNADTVKVREIDGGMIPLMEQKPTEVADEVLSFLAAVGD